MRIAWCKILTSLQFVDAEADPSLGADEAILAVTMNDGTVFEKHVEHAIGSLEVAMDDDMLQTKFED